ncbi:MAG: ATP-binding cassette domain-containing protein [Candidatus Lokiarchaeota archaeon]|nr:ATP-binding cassette domain-containing protein [Candidatus Lokiarchaeota archaeon]
MRNKESEASCRAELTGNEIIHVDCVDHVYPDGTMSLDGICFSVNPGEIVAICGPNGSGKTTLLEHLVGILTPKKGRIMMFGKRLEKKSYKKVRRVVGLIFQNSDDQLFSPTVMDDVMFGPRNLGLSKEEAYQKAYDALKTVFGKFPKHLADKIPHYLSGGEKKLVAIAGILAMEPKAIVADEITANLDPYHGRLVENILIKMKEELDISVVFATHDLNMALRLADRVCLIDKGAIIKEGTPKEIFLDDDILKLDLEIPQILRIYRNLKQFFSDIAEDTIPRTVNQLNKLINRLLKTNNLS